MRTSKKMLILSCLLFSNALFAGEFGICNYGKVTLEALTCYGNASLNGTTINGKVIVAGALSAKNVSANGLTVSGPTQISDSHIVGSTQINGPATINNSTLDNLQIQGNLSLTNSIIKQNIVSTGTVILQNTAVTGSLLEQASDINLINSKIYGSIVVTSKDVFPVVKLTNTQIEESIRFAGKMGNVNIDANSKIAMPLQNGQLIQS